MCSLLLFLFLRTSYQKKVTTQVLKCYNLETLLRVLLYRYADPLYQTSTLFDFLIGPYRNYNTHYE